MNFNFNIVISQGWLETQNPHGPIIHICWNVNPLPTYFKGGCGSQNPPWNTSYLCTCCILYVVNNSWNPLTSDHYRWSTIVMDWVIIWDDQLPFWMSYQYSWLFIMINQKFSWLMMTFDMMLRCVWGYLWDDFRIILDWIWDGVGMILHCLWNDVYFWSL